MTSQPRPINKQLTPADGPCKTLENEPMDPNLLHTVAELWH